MNVQARVPTAQELLDLLVKVSDALDDEPPAVESNTTQIVAIVVGAIYGAGAMIVLAVPPEAPVLTPPAPNGAPTLPTREAVDL